MGASGSVRGRRAIRLAQREAIRRLHSNRGLSAAQLHQWRQHPERSERNRPLPHPQRPVDPLGCVLDRRKPRVLKRRLHVLTYPALLVLD